MDRRNFIRSIAAATTMAAMPAGALMSAQVSTAGITTIARANLYTWSAMIARTKGACSPQLLMKSLNIDATRANFLFNRLISNNVVNVAGSTIVNQTKSVIETNRERKIGSELLETDEQETSQKLDLDDEELEPVESKLPDLNRDFEAEITDKD